MSDSSGSRQCPTRLDGADPLIAHTIDRPTCRERQRRLYHKCFSCALRNEDPRTPRPAKPKPLPPLQAAAPPQRAVG